MREKTTTSPPLTRTAYAAMDKRKRIRSFPSLKALFCLMREVAGEAAVAYIKGSKAVPQGVHEHVVREQSRILALTRNLEFDVLVGDLTVEGAVPAYRAAVRDLADVYRSGLRTKISPPGAVPGDMKTRDQVLYGDVGDKAGIGTKRIGFVPLSSDDGESSEDRILAMYREAGHREVRGVHASGCLEFVEFLEEPCP